MFEFDMKVFGVIMTVVGEFEPPEPPSYDCPGWPAEFHIESVVHKGEELAVDELPDYILEDIVEIAFEKERGDRL